MAPSPAAGGLQKVALLAAVRVALGGGRGGGGQSAKLELTNYRQDGRLLNLDGINPLPHEQHHYNNRTAY